MSSISQAGIDNSSVSVVTPVQPYRPAPLNVGTGLSSPLPPPPLPPPLSSSLPQASGLGSAARMTFDINNPSFSVQPTPLPYPTSASTPSLRQVSGGGGRTPSLRLDTGSLQGSGNDGQLQYQQQHQQQQPYPPRSQQPYQQSQPQAHTLPNLHHLQHTPTFHPSHDPTSQSHPHPAHTQYDQPLKKRPRLHYDLDTNPNQHHDQNQVPGMHVQVGLPMPVSMSMPMPMIANVDVGVDGRQHHHHQGSNQGREQEQRYQGDGYREPGPGEMGLSAPGTSSGGGGISGWGRSPGLVKREDGGPLQLQQQQQQQCQQNGLPPPDTFAYPGSQPPGSAAYPSHIPHLNQPIPHDSPAYGSGPGLQHGQAYGSVQDQGAVGFGGRYQSEHTLPSPLTGGDGYHSTGTATAPGTGYGGQFSPIVLPQSQSYQQHSGQSHFGVSGDRPSYTSAYSDSAMTQPGSLADVSGYALVGTSMTYPGSGTGQVAGSSSGAGMYRSYLPPSSVPGAPSRRPVMPTESLDERTRKFSSESSSLASPVYRSQSSSYRPFPTYEADGEADTGWSAEPSSSTTKVSSSAARGASATSAGGVGPEKGKRKSSGSAPGGGKSQPVFVTKLYNMLQDPAIQRSGLLKWSQDGAGFICTNPTDFSRMVLPQFFKHNNWHSFVRQLNMYGFSKQVNDVFLTLTSPSALPMAWEFRHATFRRDDPEGIASIKRRSVKQTNQLRLQMEAEAAARQAAQDGGYGQHEERITEYTGGKSHSLVKRPSTTSPALSNHSESAPRYEAIRYSHPIEPPRIQGYAVHSAPPYPIDPGGRSLPSSYQPTFPRYTSYAPSSGNMYDTYRLPNSSVGSQYFAPPLSSASAVSQYPVLQPMGDPPVYQSISGYEPDRANVHALARQAGSISSQASHLAHEQEALKQNTEEIRQETGVILDSLSVSIEANQSFPDEQASRLRQGIERLQDKVSERERRVSESLARVESITAHAHALQDSLTAAASNAPLSNDARGIRTVNYPSLANAWAINPDTLPPMQQSQHVYDSDDHQQQGTRNASFDQPRNLDMPPEGQNQDSHRTNGSGSASQGSDDDDEDGEGEGEGESDRSHSRTRSGSGSGGIKELLN